MDHYHNLIKRLEVDSTIHPDIFRTKVILISSTAYVVLFGFLAATALLIYFGIKLAYDHQRTSNLIRIGLFLLVMIPTFFVVLRMFFMRLPPPEGFPLVREDAPKFFGMLDKMRKKLKGPPIHHVLVDQEFNAAIFQRPRWGLFGGHTNYLILGLPYMLGMTPKEMVATIAHEYGHLCGDHGKISSWIYRQRRTIGALYEEIKTDAEDNWVHAIMLRVLDRFMPHYNAYTFVLSRQNEYEADQTATRLVGAEANASGLIRGELLGQWVHDEFWPGLYRQAEASAKPAFLPYVSMRTAFKASHPQWATQEKLASAWSEPSGLLDTHPALRDRVEATGEAAAVPVCVETSAAEVLLGNHARKIIEQFDDGWWGREKDAWTARHQYVTRSKSRLKELSAQPLSALKLQDLQEFAMLSAEFESPSAAKTVLEHLLRQPGGPFPKAEYHYGCILLDQRNDRGLDHLVTSAQSEHRLVESAVHAGYAYLCRTSSEEAAEQWAEKLWPRDDDE